MFRPGVRPRPRPRIGSADSPIQVGVPQAFYGDAAGDRGRTSRGLPQYPPADVFRTGGGTPYGVPTPDVSSRRRHTPTDGRLIAPATRQWPRWGESIVDRHTRSGRGVVSLPIRKSAIVGSKNSDLVFIWRNGRRRNGSFNFSHNSCPFASSSTMRTRVMRHGKQRMVLDACVRNSCPHACRGYETL